MTRAQKIINDSYNKPESKYGSTRSTLFGKFYERILSKWFEKTQGYQFQQWPNGSPHKPRIYWRGINLDGLDFSRDWFSKEDAEKYLNSLKDHKSHCTLDGVLKREVGYSIWEAKNWPLYPEKGPKSQIKKYFTSYPWVFSKTFNFSGEDLEISEFLFSYWYIKPEDKQDIEQEINYVIGESKFRIILTTEVIDNCINKQYDWYVRIVEQERSNIEQFFNQLLGLK